MKPIHGVYAVAALALFQVFFRYSYVTTTAGPHNAAAVYRIDRLTQKACIIGPFDRCDATPTPIPTPTATPSLELEDQRAIELVKNSGDKVAWLFQQGNTLNNYHWDVTGRYTNDGKEWTDHQNNDASPASENSATYPVRHVWCIRNYGLGAWDWEVHLDTHEVFLVPGNTRLTAKYDTPPTPTPPEPTSSHSGHSSLWDEPIPTPAASTKGP
jgi:hypothetical protein